MYVCAIKRKKSLSSLAQAAAFAAGGLFLDFAPGGAGVVGLEECG